MQAQICAMEESISTSEFAAAMQEGTQVVKNHQKQHTVTSVEKTVDGVQQIHEHATEVNTLLGGPLGAAADVNEDEIEKELDRMAHPESDKESSERVMPSVTGCVPAQPQISTLPSHPTRVDRTKTAEELELQELELEMTLA